MKIYKAKPLQEACAIAVVVSRFNEAVTDALWLSAKTRLSECNITDVTVVFVPGAIEIPLIAKQLATQNKVDAIVCLGAVIRGETSHYDYVCSQASEGCQAVMLTHDIPVIFGVLTTEDEAQAFARVSKGRESIDAALEMISLRQQLKKLC